MALERRRRPPLRFRDSAVLVWRNRFLVRCPNFALLRRSVGPLTVGSVGSLSPTSGLDPSRSEGHGHGHGRLGGSAEAGGGGGGGGGESFAGADAMEKAGSSNNGGGSGTNSTNSTNITNDDDSAKAFSDAELIEDKVFAFALRSATLKQSAHLASVFEPLKGPLGPSARSLTEWWSSQCGPMMQMLQCLDKVADEPEAPLQSKGAVRRVVLLPLRAHEGAARALGQAARHARGQKTNVAGGIFSHLLVDSSRGGSGQGQHADGGNDGDVHGDGNGDSDDDEHGQGQGQEDEREQDPLLAGWGARTSSAKRRKTHWQRRP